jgi:sugar lactone lactonase YvrE
MIDIKILVDSKHVLGEGPVWDSNGQRLYFVDTVSRELSRCAPDGSQIRTWRMPGEIGSFALREKGGALVALDSGLQFFDFDSGTFECIAHPEEGKEGVRFNDGKADRKGRFVVASLDLQASAANKPWRGRLFRLDIDLSLHELDAGFWISNGPCWSPDDKTFFMTDSRAEAIYAYDWDTEHGTVANRRVFVETGKGSLPDGATVDEEGFLWSAECGAESGNGALHRYAPDGTLDRVVPMPTAKITSLTFGGPDLDIAYVTTMSIPTNIAESSLDGKLLAVHGLGVRGIPEPRFGG